MIRSLRVRFALRQLMVAIVRVSFNWSIHGGEGTYVLLRRDGEWVVLVRDCRYSL